MYLQQLHLIMYLQQLHLIRYLQQLYFIRNHRSCECGVPAAIVCVQSSYSSIVCAEFLQQLFMYRVSPAVVCVQSISSSCVCAEYLQQLCVCRVPAAVVCVQSTCSSSVFAEYLQPGGVDPALCTHLILYNAAAIVNASIPELGPWDTKVCSGINIISNASQVRLG